MDCPLCFSKAERILTAQNTHGRIKISSEKFAVFQCCQCKVIFPQVKNRRGNYFQKYYGQGYFAQGNWLELILSRLSLFFKGRLLKKFKKRGNLLDIGCGRGAFLASLPYVYKRWGIETDKKSCQFIKQNYQNITISCSTIEEAPLKEEEFNIVTLWHVLEHLSQPKKVFKKIYRGLKKNGVLIIETPNTNSLGFRLAREDWFHLDCPRHLFLFNQKNLVNLLKKNRFKVIDVKGNLLGCPLDFFWDLGNFCGFKNRFLKISAALLLFLPSLMVKVFFPLRPDLSETITIIAKK